MASAESDDGEAYRGLVGAIPYAIRRSDSWLFRCYGIVGGVIAGFVTLLFGLGLILLIGETAGVGGGSFTVSRAFFVVVGLFAVGPMVAPILFVARRHRRGLAVDSRYDAALAASGFLFVVALYAGAVVSAPREGTAGPAVEAAYALPRVAGIVPPLAAAVLTVLLHRRLAAA